MAFFLTENEYLDAIHVFFEYLNGLRIQMKQVIILIKRIFGLN